MATKTLFDELDEILTAEEKLALQILQKNQSVKERFEQGDTLLKMYLEANPPEAEPKPAPVVEAPKPAVTAPAATPPAPANAAPALDEIAKLLDTRLGELEKKFVPASEVSKLRSEWTATNLRLSHDLNRVENSHRAEFGEELDFGAFDKYVSEHPGHKTLQEAHNAMVAEKRMEAKIAAGIEAYKKANKTSEVPAQTKGSALSPAQEVLAKARATEGGDGKSNAIRAAEKMAKMVRDRESASE